MQTVDCDFRNQPQHIIYFSYQASIFKEVRLLFPIAPIQSLNGLKNWFVIFGFMRRDSLTQIASTVLTTLGFCFNLLVKQIVTDIIILIDIILI